MSGTTGPLSEAEGRELDELIREDRRQWKDGVKMGPGREERLDELVERLWRTQGHLLAVAFPNSMFDTRQRREEE